MDRSQLEAFFTAYGMVPAQIVDAWQQENLAGVLGPAFTATFLHGGWLHLLGNMLFLWVFGDNVADLVGSFRYLAFYLSAGMLANLAHAFTNPASMLPTIGASGAVAGVLGAYFINFPRSKVLTLLFLGILVTVVEIPAIFFLLYWFFLQLVNGVASLGVATAATSGVAWWAHIGGFVAGALLINFFRRSHIR